MKRISVLNPIGQVGGAERVLLAGLRALATECPGTAVQLLLLQDGPLRDAAEALGATVDVVPMPERLGQLGETQYRGGRAWIALPAVLRTAPELFLILNRLRNRIRRFRPDLIHTHGVKAHVLSQAIRPRGTPVVGTIHDFLGERPLAGKLVRRLGGLTHAIAISEAVRQDLGKVCPGLPVTTVRNPVDTEHFTPGPGDRALLDQASELDTCPAGTVRVGLVATYANWKGHRLFLQALATLKDLPLRGYIIGGPIYSTPGSQVTRDELLAEISRLGLVGRVGLVPFQRDPLAVYRALDVVVHASIRPEPFGLTIVEAMSCGKPVVISAGGGAIELFEEGVSALGFPPGNVQELADRIRRLASNLDLRIQLGIAARQHAQQFSQPRFAQELITLYRQLISTQTA